MMDTQTNMNKKEIDMAALYKEVAELLLKFKQCVVLTGAGVSAESGIPTFRSQGGLWEKYDPAVYASIEVFRKDPSKYWTLRGEFIRNYNDYKPNKAHFALAELENLNIVRQVITQNIDGLHKKAGNKNIIEIHGSLREIYCLECGKEYIAPDIPSGTPPYCNCGGILKPNTVLFGEQLPQEALILAQNEAVTCKNMLLIGTSAVVYPAAYLPVYAKKAGAKIIEINIERAFTDSDYYINAKAGIALPAIVKEIETKIKGDS
jgi:NAD-dependent deacetylase